MTNYQMTRDENEATRIPDPRSDQRGRPRIRRVAVIRTGRNGFRLVGPSGELALKHP